MIISRCLLGRSGCVEEQLEGDSLEHTPNEAARGRVRLLARLAGLVSGTPAKGARDGEAIIQSRKLEASRYPC